MATDLSQASSAFWGKAAAAGMIGGLAMGLYEMTTAAMDGMSFFAPMNMIAASLPAFRPPAPAFAPAATTFGLVLHMITSAFWGLAFAGLIAAAAPRVLSNVGWAAAAGLAYGFAVYLVMGLGIGPIIDPVLRMAHPLHYFVGHLVYGVVLGVALAAWTRRRDLAVTFAPGARVEEPTASRR